MKQGLQAINWSKHHDSKLTINHAIKLSTWRLSQTSSYSYLRVAAIRMDVQPVGENPTNMTHTLPTPVHVCPSYGSSGRSSYVATFREAPTDLDRSHCSWEKRAPDTIHSTPADRSVGLYPASLLNQPIKQGGVSQAPDDDQLLGLPGPYHWHVISTFNTCSQGPTEQSLIDTGGGCNLGGASSPHTHSPTSCLPFAIVAPPGLHFNQAPLLKPQCE
jgi:hypothetical protein